MAVHSATDLPSPLPARLQGRTYGWAQASGSARVIVVEGLLDVAALWQVDFRYAVGHWDRISISINSPELCQLADRLTYICFDADRNGSGQRAARSSAIQLRHAGVEALRVALPEGNDPASFFAQVPSAMISGAFWSAPGHDFSSRPSQRPPRQQFPYPTGRCRGPRDRVDQPFPRSPVHTWITSLCRSASYAYTLLHFVRWWSRRPGVDAMHFRPAVHQSTLVDYVRDQLDELPKPAPENINRRSAMLRRLFHFYLPPGDAPCPPMRPAHLVRRATGLRTRTRASAPSI